VSVAASGAVAQRPSGRRRGLEPLVDPDEAACVELDADRGETDVVSHWVAANRHQEIAALDSALTSRFSHPKVNAVATAAAGCGDFRVRHDIDAILAKDRLDRFLHVRVFRRKQVRLALNYGHAAS
jgi:hypothetical protein